MTIQLPTLSDTQKQYLYDKYTVPVTNIIREIERLAVSHESHRLIEVKVNCLHTLLAEMNTEVGMPFREADVHRSVYGENGDKDDGG